MIKKLLIANRGEIAIRIARAAAELGINSVSIFPEDDANSLHVIKADETVALPGSGAQAYLDKNAVIEAALQSNADAIHPGYGFLSENAEFANLCRKHNIIFVGPGPEQTTDVFHRSRVLPNIRQGNSFNQRCSGF